MSKFVIEGSHKLKGEINIAGMKNAATPILAATLLAKEECYIKNIPKINDVKALLEILKSIGAKVEWKQSNVKISCKGANLRTLNKQKMQAMRSSVLLLAPLLSRFKKVKIPQPGGCIIGNRPIDTHLYVFERLGAKVEKEGNEFILSAKELKGNTVILPEFSVTATENAIMAAVLAKGRTQIKLAATEPHVQDLSNFLNSMGAKIEGIGTHTINITGVETLHGTAHSVIPDQIEAGTFAVAAAVTRSEVVIKNIIPEHLEIVLLKLKEAGVNFKVGDNYLQMHKTGNFKRFKIQSLPYPGFPTDLQAPFSVLATQAKGTSLIHDPLYEARLSHIRELMKMGTNAVICDPHRVLISGPTPLFGQVIQSPDLRAGVTLIIAGLIAEGITEISQAEIIDRGYEKIEERLRKVGAHIRRVKD